MAKVLFAWELGAGLGHVTRIQRLAARLAAQGVRIFAAVRNLANAHILAADGIEIFQAPIWPGSLPEASPLEQSSATFGDMLAGYGLADANLLTATLAAWDDLFVQIDPDLVVADYAPAAMLATRGRLPLGAVGNGFTLPPAEMDRFPLLHRVSPPLRQEENILQLVNRALRSRRLAPLDRLPQLLSSDIRSVQTFPILDPYREQRVLPVDGPIMRTPRPRDPDSRSIFVYIADVRPLRTDIVEALLPLGRRLWVFGPGLSPAQTAALSNADATIEARPLALEAQLAKTRLVIHLGGLGVASEALAAGVPQLVLSVDIEKDLNGEALERAGVGRLVKVHDPAAKISTDLFETVAGDEALASRATTLGEEHRRLLKNFDPLSKFERQCLALLH